MAEHESSPVLDDGTGLQQEAVHVVICDALDQGLDVLLQNCCF